jgi:hypothetical protein
MSIDLSDIVAKLPVRPIIQPLTEDDRQILRQVEELLPQIQDLLARAHDVGIDVAAKQDLHNAHVNVVAKLNHRFWGGQAPPQQE